MTKLPTPDFPNSLPTKDSSVSQISELSPLTSMYPLAGHSFIYVKLDKTNQNERYEE